MGKPQVVADSEHEAAFLARLLSDHTAATAVTVDGNAVDYIFDTTDGRRYRVRLQVSVERQT